MVGTGIHRVSLKRSGIQDRRVVLRDHTAGINSAAEREQENLLRFRADRVIDVLEPPTEEEDGRLGAAMTRRDEPYTSQKPTE